MKNCKECKKEFRGRTDKIFCSVKCKNRAYYKLREKVKLDTHHIDKILHRNYAILLQEMEGVYGSKKIKALDLSKKKFNFNYITNYRVNKNGKTYRYVYNLAWMSFSDNEVLIIKKGRDFY